MRGGGADEAAKAAGGGRGGGRTDVPSPDGQRTAYIKDWNLWVRDAATGKETPLTVKSMAGRPRTISDEDLIAATIKVMSRLGPVKMTLAAVAKEAGVTAATLVQRFGSKRGLMLKIAGDTAEFGDACFDMVRAAHPESPLAALVAAVTGMAQMANTPEELSNSLAFLQIDISDPDFYVHTLAMSKKTVAGYRALLKRRSTLAS